MSDNSSSVGAAVAGISFGIGALGVSYGVFWAVREIQAIYDAQRRVEEETHRVVINALQDLRRGILRFDRTVQHGLRVSRSGVLPSTAVDNIVKDTAPTDTVPTVDKHLPDVPVPTRAVASRGSSVSGLPFQVSFNNLITAGAVGVTAFIGTLLSLHNSDGEGGRD